MIKELSNRKIELFSMVKDDLGLEENNILYNNIILIRYINRYSKTTAGYYFVVLKDKIIIYSLDSNYRVIKRRTINIIDIECAGRAGIRSCILVPDEKLIRLAETTIYLDPTYLNQEEKITDLIRLLRKLGVKDIRNKEYSINIALRLFIYFVLAIYAIFFFINIVK